MPSLISCLVFLKNHVHATQSVCSCHHLCWAPAHLPLHFWATSSVQLFSICFRFSVNLQRWERKVLRLFGHSCSKPLGTCQLSQYNRYKAVSRRDEKGRGGWLGGLGSLDKTVKDTWTLGPLWRCWDAADTESDKLYCSSKATPLCLYSTLSPTMVPTMVIGEPHICLPYLPPFLPVQGGLKPKIQMWVGLLVHYPLSPNTESHFLQKLVVLAWKRSSKDP